MKILITNTSESVKVLNEIQSIATILTELACSSPQDEPVFVLDIDDLVAKYKNWYLQMPKVRPFYAVKCNDNYHVLKTLATLGTGFDCASEGEMRIILALGVEPSRIINAQPTKMISHLKFAAQKSIATMTFDCESELHKIKEHFPNARLVLRICYDDTTAKTIFGKKFGCDPFMEAEKLIKLAAQLNLNVIGTSFHVGSGCGNHKVYYEAIKICRSLFDTAKLYGYTFSLLDIGGGFPGNKNTTISTIANYVNAAIEEFFLDPSIEIIAEPGRYFVASAFTLATNVHSQRIVNFSGIETCMYYINDGVFGSLNCIINDGVSVTPMILTKSDEDTQISTIWGPTCAGIDMICKNIQLPKLDIGDWIFFENVGAYSLSIASNFNLFPLAKVYPYVSQKNWSNLNKTAKQ